MSKFTSVFKRFDKLIFKQVDAYKSSSFYLQSLDQFNALDESVQKLIKQIYSFTLIVLPLAIIGLLFFQIQNVNKNVTLKRDLLKTLYSIESHQRQRSLLENSVVSPFKITSRKDLKNRIINEARSHSISSQKIRIENFSQLQATTHLAQTEARIKFKGFSTRELTRFLTGLLRKEKIKVIGLDVNIFPKENLLKGFISIVHFSLTKK